LNIFGKYKNIIKCHWAESSRSPTWPGSASASAACAAHGLVQLGRRKRARGGAARLRCGGDLNGAWEAAEEGSAGPHRRVDGGAAELVGVDGGVEQHGEAWTPTSSGTAV
jgi:hypothetical protein